jgi:hypothetical protein
MSNPITDYRLQITEILHFAFFRQLAPLASVCELMNDNLLKIENCELKIVTDEGSK